MTNPEVDHAVAFFKQGYTCTQSILASFANATIFRKPWLSGLENPLGRDKLYQRYVRVSDWSFMVLGLHMDPSTAMMKLPALLPTNAYTADPAIY